MQTGLHAGAVGAVDAAHGVHVVAFRRVVPLLVLQIGVSLFVNLWLFPSRLLDPIAMATSGLLAQTLVANLLTIVVVLGAMAAVGRVGPGDVGVTRRGIASALWLGFGVWLFGLLIAVVSAVWSGRPLEVGAAWQDGRATWTLGQLLAQLFGNAFFEEVFFRGSLCIQTAAAFGALRPRTAGRARWWAAVGVSQTIFAVVHMPNRIAFATHDSIASWAGDMVGLWFAGVAFSVLCIACGTVWIPVVLHSLLNRPTALLATEDRLARIAIVVAVVAVSIAAIVRLCRGRGRFQPGAASMRSGGRAAPP